MSLRVPETSIARMELKGVSKTFGAVRALQDVDFRVEPGQVHALMGENGAGKSTLIKILTGALPRDSGEIRLDGEAVEFGSPAHARSLGIDAVYQELNRIPTMSVIKNLTLGRQPRHLGLISWKKARERTIERLKRVKTDIDVDRPLGSYPVAVQQLIAIARALEQDTRVLVLDEPTASLDASEADLLFTIIQDLKARGIAIVFITHFIDQVYRIANRISVLRNGRLVGSALTAELPPLQLISLMLGRDLEQAEARPPAGAATLASQPVLRARDVGRKRIMAPFDLSLHAGEVVGLGGLLGSGRTEVCNLVYGTLKRDSGSLEISGKPVTGSSPRASLLEGVALCPEDRKAQGIIPELTVRENIVLALQSKRGWLRQLTRVEQDRLANDMIEALAIVTSNREQPVGQLSGGNQQKVVLARALVSEPIILILDEPTRGIDVGAHAEILNLICRLCAQGLALLVASSELDELVAVSNRIAVMRDRHKAGEMEGAEITRESVMQMIAGG